MHRIFHRLSGRVRRLAAIAVVGAMAVVAMPAHCGEAARDIRIELARAPAMPPGARTAAIYLTIVNAGDTPDRLVAAASPLTALVELHAMRMDGGVMRMRAVPEVIVPARGKVSFAPGALHLMLVEPKPPLAAGQRVPLALTFARAGRIDVMVEVDPLQPAAPSHGH